MGHGHHLGASSVKGATNISQVPLILPGLAGWQPTYLHPQISGTHLRKSDVCPKKCYHQPTPRLCRAGRCYGCLKFNSRHPLATAAALSHVSPRPQAHPPESPSPGFDTHTAQTQCAASRAADHAGVSSTHQDLSPAPPFLAAAPRQPS